MEKFALAVTLLSFIGAVCADDKGYPGLKPGYTAQKIDTRTIAPLHDACCEKSNGQSDEAYLGYRFNEHFAIGSDHHYLDNGKTAANVPIPHSGYRDTTGDLSAKRQMDTQNHVFSLTAVGTLPVSSTFSLFAKAGRGLFYSKSKAHSIAALAGAEKIGDEKSGAHTIGVPVLGVGAEYTVDKSTKIRLEYENFGRNQIKNSEEPATLKIDPRLQPTEMFFANLQMTFN